MSGPGDKKGAADKSREHQKKKQADQYRAIAQSLDKSDQQRSYSDQNQVYRPGVSDRQPSLMDAARKGRETEQPQHLARPADRDPWSFTPKQPLDPAYPFHYLGETERKKARQSQDQYNRLRHFHEAHGTLTAAAENATLGIDRSGKLTLSESASKEIAAGLGIPKLVKEIMVKQLQGKIEGEAISRALGKRAAGWIGLLKTLGDIQKRLANEDLFKGVGREADEKRFKAKITLLTQVMAIGETHRRHREAPRPLGYNPNEIQLELNANYWNYDRALRDYSSHIHKDWMIGLKRRDPQEYERIRGSGNEESFEQGG